MPGRAKAKPGSPPAGPVKILDIESSELIKSFDIRSSSVTWAADSQSLIYVATRGGILNIWAQPLARGLPRRSQSSRRIIFFRLLGRTMAKQLAEVRGSTLSDIVLISSSQ